MNAVNKHSNLTLPDSCDVRQTIVRRSPDNDNKQKRNPTHTSRVPRTRENLHRPRTDRLFSFVYLLILIDIIICKYNV